MATYSIRKIVKIDFSTIEDDSVEDWAKCLNVEYVDEIPDLEVKIRIDIEPDDLSDELIKREFETRFRSDLDAISHAYSLIAAGDTAEAMEILSREFRLAPPVPRKESRRSVVARQRIRPCSKLTALH